MARFPLSLCRIACATAITAGLGLAPVPALAVPYGSATSGPTSSRDASSDAAAADKALFYRELNAGSGSGASPMAADLSASVSPYSMSDELRYFTDYESGDYDQGFSPYDGYHALGYYQFDNRYGLQSFLVACYNYDPSTFGMLAWLKDPGVDISSEAMYDSGAGGLTETGRRLEDSWHAAYAVNGELFARLQDGWYYKSYIQPSLSYLDARGLNMDGRRDCIKGLVSGVSSLFGSGGWRYFVGGSFDGTDWPGAGLTGSMSDREFATTLCNYIIGHVAEFYPNQPQYHEGWRNRYRNELSDILEYLGDEPEAYPSDVDPDDWYVTDGSLEYVLSHGYMNGYGNGETFGPYDSLTRGQVVMILWNIEGRPSASSEAFSDVDYSRYYGSAIRWARAAGVGNGHGNTFSPDAKVTRQELATFMANYARRIEGADTSVGLSSLDRFADASSIAGWALQNVAWAAREGILNGAVDSSGNRLMTPSGEASRAQMAVVIRRYMESR